jgi:type VI secretion system secreted protein VgrG
MAVAHSMLKDKESPLYLTLPDINMSLQVVQYSGHEALNQPYRFDIEVIGPTSAIPFEQWLQQPAYLDLGQDQGVHGVLHSVTRKHHETQRAGYTLILVPHLQALDRQRCRRIFHNLSVPMILRRLFEEHQVPFDSYCFELTTGHYPLRAFCIQYEETDLAFAQRLCEEEGIHYHFEHQRNRHVLILADESLSFPQSPLLMPCQNERQGDTSGAVICEVFQRHASPSLPLRADTRNRGIPGSKSGAANHLLDAPTAPGQRPASEQLHREQLGRRQLERLRCRHLQIHGRSHHPALRSARILQLSEHPQGSFNDQWLITENRHQGRQPCPFDDGPATMAPQYRNQFTAIPWSSVFRPALNQTRPSIPGYQPGRICGAVGQPAQVDDQGRIQVTLWPAQASPNQSGGLWLPVALACTVGGIDPARLPLAGSDVLVSFLDCDPDRPVLCAVMGSRGQPRPPRPRAAAAYSRLLLDWLVNRPDFTP